MPNVLRGLRHFSFCLTVPGKSSTVPAEAKARVNTLSRGSLRGSGTSTFSPNQPIETLIDPSRSLGQQFHKRLDRICDKARVLSAVTSASEEGQRGSRIRIAVPCSFAE